MAGRRPCQRVSCASMTDSVLPRPVTTPSPSRRPSLPSVRISWRPTVGWRASTPAREHRCTVVTPPAILAAEKQRRLCLTAEHVGCSTYLAATNPTDADEVVTAAVAGHVPTRPGDSHRAAGPRPRPPGLRPPDVAWRARCRAAGWPRRADGRGLRRDRGGASLGGRAGPDAGPGGRWRGGLAVWCRRPGADRPSRVDRGAGRGRSCRPRSSRARLPPGPRPRRRRRMRRRPLRGPTRCAAATP